MPTPLVNLDTIKLDLIAADGSAAIRELHEAACGGGMVRDPALLLKDLFTRQKLGGTCLDQDVALPHARTLAVEDFIFAVGRSAKGVAFDPEHRSIRLVLLVGAPAAAVQEYLKLIVGVMQRLRQPELRRQLLAAATTDEFRSSWVSGLGDVVGKALP
jgi:mannose PTS system EIIBCA component